jgi:CysZ protein
VIPVEGPSLKPLRLPFRDGLSALVEGARCLARTPALWPFAAVPVTFFVVIFALGAVAAFIGAFKLAALAIGGVGFWASFGRAVLGLVFGAVGVALAGLIGLSFAQPLSGFALDRIVRAVYKADRHPAPPDTGVSFAQSVLVAVLGLAVGLPILVLLSTVSFFVPVLVVVTVPLKIVVAGLMMAWDLCDYPMSLEGIAVGDRVAHFRRNFGATLAFGVPLGLVLAVPLLNLVVLPFGVAGAARLILRLKDAELLEGAVSPTGDQ